MASQTFEGILIPLSHISHGHMYPDLGLDRLWGAKKYYFNINLNDEYTCLT